MRLTPRSAALGALVTTVAAVGTLAAAQAFAGEATTPRPSPSISTCVLPPTNGVTPAPKNPHSNPSPRLRTSAPKPTTSPVKPAGKPGPGVTKVPGGAKPTVSVGVTPTCVPTTYPDSLPSGSAPIPSGSGYPTAGPTPTSSRR